MVNHYLSQWFPVQSAQNIAVILLTEITKLLEIDIAYIIHYGCCSHFPTPKTSPNGKTYQRISKILQMINCFVDYYAIDVLLTFMSRPLSILHFCSGKWNNVMITYANQQFACCWGIYVLSVHLVVEIGKFSAQDKCSEDGKKSVQSQVVFPLVKCPQK